MREREPWAKRDQPIEPGHWKRVRGEEEGKRRGKRREGKGPERGAKDQEDQESMWPQWRSGDLGDWGPCAEEGWVEGGGLSELHPGFLWDLTIH